MEIKLAYICSRGGKRKNDDTVLTFEDTKRACVFVGDGLGGYHGGKIASEAAGKAVLSSFASSEDVLSKEWMLRTAEQAQEVVLEAQRELSEEMKTTLVVLAAGEDSVRWMHIGDSRLYHFVNDKIKEQTSDHSVSQLAVMMGDITKDQIRFHADRNRILRALGGANYTPEISPLVSIGYTKHVFLLCSDGFWEYVKEEEMEETLRRAKKPEDWLDSMETILKDRAVDDHDNYSAAAVFARKKFFNFLDRD